MNPLAAYWVALYLVNQQKEHFPMNKLLKLVLGWLFGKGSTAKITSGFTKVVAKLEAHADSVDEDIAAYAKRISEMANARYDAIDERTKARNAAEKIKGLFS